MVRAFVALELSGEIREGIRAAQEILRGCPVRLTFVDPPLIHITMKFLGEVDERIVPKIIAALQVIPFVPFTVTAGRVTVNNPRRPHTVWCEIEDGGKSRDLFRLVETALEPLGFLRETRPFTPHATLARVKVPDPSLFGQIDLLRGRTYGSCAVTGLKLKKSTLTPEGPVYEDLLVVAW
ncbi:MAG: RNA 2',3'-cyclic phosphodiesterase [Methanoregula sp.]|nr:RNA 2',3'-cyclic phosphodiesterase [Methanoregula sp.]